MVKMRMNEAPGYGNELGGSSERLQLSVVPPRQDTSESRHGKSLTRFRLLLMAMASATAAWLTPRSSYLVI